MTDAKDFGYQYQVVTVRDDGDTIDSLVFYSIPEAKAYGEKLAQEKDADTFYIIDGDGFTVLSGTVLS